MDDQEISQLDQLLAIADEEDTPMSVKDVEFLEKLSSMRGMTLSPRQASWFDDLVDRHLKGETRL